jgi:hypothetical protein
MVGPHFAELKTVVLYRPVGEQEWALIAQSGNRSFPLRLPAQPIFYPVLNEEYAVQIARDWNAKYNQPPVGYVTRFRVRQTYLDRYEAGTAGAAHHQEYWIPAENLPEFNENIVGSIEVIAKFAG